MEFIFAVTLLMIGLMLFFGCAMADEEFGTFIGIVIVVVDIILIGCGVFNHKPTAIDVYRNKTTLEITYKDSVAIDSIVVFKNK